MAATSEADRVEAILRRHGSMVTARMPWESHWSQIARRVLPRQDAFNREHAPGNRRTEYIHDSTAPIALDRFAAAMEGLAAPRGQRWHGLAHPDPRLSAKPNVKAYFEAVTDILCETRYSASSGFATQFHECMVGTGAFGTGPLWIEEQPGRGIIYSARDLSEIYLEQNMHGRIDTVSRAFKYSARQAAQRWGREQLPPNMARALETTPDRTFDFIHFIRPNEDWDPSRADAAGMAFASDYVAIDGKKLMSSGGFHTMPLPVCRYVKAPLEVYGRSPAMMVLPDIKMANAKTLIRAGHRAIDPPLLMPEDGVLSRLQTRPGAMNYGGVNSRGEPLVRPLEGGGNLAFGGDLLEQSRRVINDAFLVTLFQVLVDSPDRMTATEVLERVQEKGVLLAPAVGRIETELLGPMIEREIDILARAGRLPPMPAELSEAGGEFKIVYDNPITRAAKAEQATGFLRTIEALTPMAQIDPSVYDIFDPVAAANGIADINGVPQAWRRTPEQAAAIKQQKASAAEAAQVAEAAPLIAKSALDFSKAAELQDPALA